MNIILASASPRRKELLEKAGVRFSVITGNGEEEIHSEEPQTIVQELSKTKAQQVAETLEPVGEETLVIGADTIVVCGGKVLGKPADAADAAKTLKKLQNATHQVYTGVTLLYWREEGWESHSFAECTDVTFYPVTDEEIRAYVATGDPLDKAGSYGIQGPFGIYVKGIRGDYNNVVGLPVARLFYEAKKYGIAWKG